MMPEFPPLSPLAKTAVEIEMLRDDLIKPLTVDGKTLFDIVGNDHKPTGEYCSAFYRDDKGTGDVFGDPLWHLEFDGVPQTMSNGFILIGVKGTSADLEDGRYIVAAKKAIETLRAA